MSLPRIVFISKDVRATRKMSVTALMNRFCEHGYDVTLISETFGNNIRDYKYDHRIKRLSFSMGVKNCATRAELLAHFVSQMPPSVFILTDFESEAYREFPAVIKAQSQAHKVICLPHFPFASALDRGSLTPTQMQAFADHTDVFVSNAMYSHAVQNSRLGGKSVRFPYFYPYGEGEYRAAQPGGKSILLFGSNPELIAKTLGELAAFMKNAPEATLKAAAGVRYEKTVAIYRECAQALGLEDRMVYDESDSFDELAKGCAFAVVTSKFVYPCDPFVELTARRLSVLFASSYREPAFLSADLSQRGALAAKCAGIMADPAREEYCANLSEEASARTFALWENLVAGVVAGEAPRGASGLPGDDSDEAFLAHFDMILSGEMPEKKPLTLSGLLRRIKKKTGKILFPDWLRGFLKKKLYWRERLRVSKYVSMQMSPEQVRKAQLLASKMLIALERICEKHGLRYYVAAGSLLGAARHGGPIPWDDDVDVTMPRSDYEKFIQVAQDELPEEMEFPQNNFPYGFQRIYLKGTLITRNIRQKALHGIFLDVIPLDGAAPTQKLKEKHSRRTRRLIALMLETARPQPLLMMNRERIFIWARRLFIKCFVSRKLLYWLWKRNATKYSTDTAAEWVCLPGAYGYEKECFPKEYWGEPAYLHYEGREVPVMREWEKYLTAHYRDYTMPPPVLCRQTHYLFAIDFGKYETMTVQEIEEEVAEYGKKAENLL